MRNWDRSLSKPAGRVVSAILCLAVGWALYESLTDGPVASIVNQWQAIYFFDGEHYYPKLTIVILMLPFLLPAYGAGFLWDRLSGQGPAAEAAMPHETSGWAERDESDQPQSEMSESKSRI